MAPILLDMTSTKKSAKKADKKYSADDKKAYAAAKRAEQQEMLAQAVDQMTSEEGWLRYLNTRTKFHNYSFNNVILIALQRPDATQVAGASKWKKDFSRTIIPGERGIVILAPMIIYAKDAAGKIIVKDGRKVIDRVWFKSVYVFDVAQTEGEAMPEAPKLEPIEGESHEEYIYRAEALWQHMGYTVDYDKYVGQDAQRGSVNLETKTVCVNGVYSVNSQVRTHIHELAHAMGGIDYTAYTRQQAEVIVESAAYIATAMVGLDTAGMSVPYIATWGADAEDPKAALKIMKDFTATIDSLVEKLVEGIS